MLLPAWNRDTCQLTQHVSLQCWNSDRNPDTYQAKLRYQKMQGEARGVIYRRYLRAYSYDGAKRQSYYAVQSWVKKQTSLPANVTPDMWGEIRSAFGLLPMPENQRFQKQDN